MYDNAHPPNRRCRGVGSCGTSNPFVSTAFTNKPISMDRVIHYYCSTPFLLPYGLYLIYVCCSPSRTLRDELLPLPCLPPPVVRHPIWPERLLLQPLSPFVQFPATAEATCLSNVALLFVIYALLVHAAEMTNCMHSFPPSRALRSQHTFERTSFGTLGYLLLLSHLEQTSHL